DRVETEGESFGRFLEVGSVKSSFAPPRKDTRNQGLRPSRNRRLPMGRLDSFRRRSSRNQAIPAAAAKERTAVTTSDRGRSLPAGMIPPSADTVTATVAVSMFPVPSVARASMVWSLSVKLTVAVQEAVHASLVQLSSSVPTSTNASPTLSDAFPVAT